MVASAEGTSWQTTYENAVSAARAKDWVKACQLFEQSINAKADDTNQTFKVQIAPGLVGNWRDGAPYTPHWGLGYCSYKAAMNVKEDAQKASLLQAAIANFDWLRSNGFKDRYVTFILSKSYEASGDAVRAELVRQELFTPGIAGNHIDQTYLTSEDKKALSNVKAPKPPKTVVKVQSKPKPEPTSKSPEPNIVGQTNPLKPTEKVSEKSGTTPKEEPTYVGMTIKRKATKGLDSGNYPILKGESSNGGPAPIIIVIDPTKNTNPELPSGTNPTQPSIMPPKSVPNQLKYALLIGNSKYDQFVGEVPYAANDAVALAGALKDYADYDQTHVFSIVNARREEIVDTVKTFAAQLPKDALVVLFVSALGANNPGNKKDYIMGIEATSPEDFEAGISKEELLSPLTEKASRVISIWEVDRMKLGGRIAFGGQFQGIAGSFLVWNACAVGQRCYGLQNSSGQAIGLFASELIKAMQENRGSIQNVGELEILIAPRILQASSSLAKVSGEAKQIQIPPKPLTSNLNIEDAAL
jgi:hypothetical protein